MKCATFLLAFVGAMLFLIPDDILAAEEEAGVAAERTEEAGAAECRPGRAVRLP